MRAAIVQIYELSQRVVIARSFSISSIGGRRGGGYFIHAREKFKRASECIVKLECIDFHYNRISRTFIRRVGREIILVIGYFPSSIVSIAIIESNGPEK